MNSHPTKNMGVSLLLLFIIKSLVFPTTAVFDSDLIQEYFGKKSVKVATIFGCYTKKDQVELAKKIMFGNQLVSVMNINHNKNLESIKANYQQIGVILDADCENTENFLITCGHLKYFDVKHNWLVLSSFSSIFNKFDNVILNIDADIHIAIKNLTKWTIFDIYNPAFGLGGLLIYEKIGYYNKKEGYSILNDEAKYWKRRNMTGVTFNTIIVLLEPFQEKLGNYLLNDDKRTVDTFCRFQHTLLRFCRDYYNFTLNTQLGKSWGYPFPNGSFDGMVGALERQVIHFGSCPVFVREDRMRVINYGRNTWSWKAGFLFRIPKSRTSFEIFLKPFSTSIWLITGFLGIISIVILKIVAAYEKRKHHTSVETSWSLSVVFILGAFCQQGSSSVPKMACGRITVFFVFFLSLLIYQFYSASIVSNLLMKPTNKINDLKQLLESSLKVGCEDIIYTKDLFAHTTDNVIKDLYYKKIYGKDNTSHFFTTKRGLELVKSDGYAFHVEVARAYPIIETTFSDQAICDLREVKLFKNTDLYSTYDKNSPFYNMLETCFQKLAEYGILFKEIQHWHPRKPECIQTSRPLASFNVGLDEFYPALMILLIGIIVSLTILVVEKYAEMVNLRKRQRKVEGIIFPFAN